MAVDITTQPKQGRWAVPISSLSILSCLWQNQDQDVLPVEHPDEEVLSGDRPLSVLHLRVLADNVVKLFVFVTDKLFRPSSMFSSMGGAYLSGAPFCSNLKRQAPGAVFTKLLTINTLDGVPY